MTGKYRVQNPEVLYCDEALVAASRGDVEEFKHVASGNARKRVRLCAHASAENALHEMLIVHARDAYVRPHKHPGKSESTHVIEGLVDVVMFDDAGTVQQVLHMGDYASGRTFYYRMAAPVFHTLLIRSDVLVFHETTNGPFDRKDTVFAPWAPAEDDAAGIESFLAGLEDRIRAAR